MVQNETASEKVSVRKSFPIYNRCSESLATVEQVKRDVEETVSNGVDVPFVAFVSGPRMNLGIEFDGYDGDADRGLVSYGLMDLIRQGADRIIIVAEVWIRNEESSEWHGVMILDATPGGDAMHLAQFEGVALGPWEENTLEQEGNLANLFERSKSLTTCNAFVVKPPLQ